MNLESEGKISLLVPFIQRFLTQSKLSLIFSKTLLLPHKTAYFLNNLHDAYKNADGKSKFILSKHFLVFKTSTSSIRLQRNNFLSSKTSWKTKRCYAEDVFKTSWRHVLKTSQRHVLKTSWRHILKISWRHVLKVSAKRLGDKQSVFWNYLYLANLNIYITNMVFHKSISDESKVNPECIN